MSVEKTMNDITGWLVRRGVPMMGARWLEVRGRRSGEMRGTVVNPLDLDGVTYLVAPRGDTQWVRNLRAAGECTISGTAYRATEIPADDRAPVIEAYLKRWGWQVKQWMRPGADPTAHPVFRLTAR